LKEKLNKMKKLNRKIFIVIAVFAAMLLLVGFAVYNSYDRTLQNAHAAMCSIRLETTNHRTLSIDDNFEASSIFVVLDKNISEPNKTHDQIFSKINAVSVLDLTMICDPETARVNWDNFRQIFKVHLFPQEYVNFNNNSQQNRVKALNIMQTLQNIPEVLYVGPVCYGEERYYLYYYGDSQLDINGDEFMPIWQDLSLWHQQWGLHDTHGIEVHQA